MKRCHFLWTPLDEGCCSAAKKCAAVEGGIMEVDEDEPLEIQGPRNKQQNASATKCFYGYISRVTAISRPSRKTTRNKKKSVEQDEIHIPGTSLMCCDIVEGVLYCN